LSIPKILRRYFLYDRKLLSDLSRCGWEALKLYYKKAVKGQKAVPGAVVAIQSFGDFLGFNPHLHVLISDGCFHENGMFSVSPTIDTGVLEKIFRHIVLKMLLGKGKISPDVIALMDKWRHTGFNVFCGRRILPRQKRSMENLDRYIIRASFSQERMTYIQGEAKVVYQSKDGREEKVFDALEWPRQRAAGCKHWQQCLARRSHAKTGAATYRAKASRWSGIMDITAMYPGGSAKRHKQIINYLVFWNRS
jgi:hypothetical protein